MSTIVGHDCDAAEHEIAALNAERDALSRAYEEVRSEQNALENSLAEKRGLVRDLTTALENRNRDLAAAREALPLIVDAACVCGWQTTWCECGVHRIARATLKQEEA